MGRFLRHVLRNRFSKDKLDLLIFFVTSRCQGRCRSCFYWQSLGKGRDLTLGEVRKILPSIGPFSTLLLSGGEPFLRRDLARLCRAFIKGNGVRRVAIPTNGLAGGAMIRSLHEMLARNPGVSFSVNFSLDGPAATHDRVRNMRGAYRRTTRNLKRVLGMRAKYANLEVVINTVLNLENAARLEDFMREVRRRFEVDDHVFEILRGEPRDKGLSAPELASVRRLHKQIRRNSRHYLAARRKMGLIDKWATLGLLRYGQKVKERALSGRAWPFPCLAGGTIGVIEPDGGVRLCELKGRVGELRKCGYDFKRLWGSEAAARLREGARSEHCYCTHVCFINMSAGAYLRSVSALPWQGLLALLGL